MGNTRYHRMGLIEVRLSYQQACKLSAKYGSHIGFEYWAELAIIVTPMFKKKGTMFHVLITKF